MKDESMKIYETTTIQYLDAETVGGEAGWYAVEAGMSASEEGAVSSLSDAGDALSSMPVILDAASQDVERPAYLNTLSTTFIVEDDFAPSQTYRFDAEQAEDIYNSVEFSDGLSLSVATVTEYTSGLSASHTSLTLTFTGSVGQIFEMHFEYAQSDFSFGWGAGEAVDLETFLSNLGPQVLTDKILKGTQEFDHIEGDWQDNEIDGVSGIDTIKGYGGNDTITLDAGFAYGGEGNDVITTHTDGVDYNVNLYGEQGNDTLVGGDKNDNLTGGTGADHIDGGAGTDYAYYTQSRKGVEIDLEAGTGKGGEAQGDTLENIEGVFGSDHDDKFMGNEGNNHFVGREGDDTFIASEGTDVYYGGRGGDDTVDYSDADAGITVDLHDFESARLSKGAGQSDVVKDIEHVTGTEFDDDISGTGDAYASNHGNNTLKGLGGNDTLRGEAGDDVLEGGSGNDTLIGGAGADKMSGGTGTDTASYAGSKGVILDLSDPSQSRGDAKGDSFESIEIFKGSETSDDIRGSEKADVLHGNGGSDKIRGHDGDDMITIESGQASGDDGNDTLIVEGGAGKTADLYGGDGADTLQGGAANTVLEGGKGADMIDGGTGTNTLSYAGSDEAVTVNLAKGTATGGDATGDSYTNVQNVRGSAHDDELHGDSGANRLEGGAGNDVLVGGAGNDDLVGGTGADTVDYSRSEDGVRVDLSAQGKSASGRGFQGPDAGGDAAGDILSGIENVRGTDFDDVLIGADDVTWRGKELSEGNNTLIGGKGDDWLEGKGGADKLSGGSGTDTASYESSDAGVNVNLATGKAKGGDAAGDKFSSIENLMGSDHNDILKGNDGVNKLEGGKGDDAFEGSFGADTIIGGEGSDTAVYTTSHKGVSVNLQKGTAKGGDAAGDTLISIENLKGSVYNDILVGDEGDNMLVGRNGDDRLKGNDGQDTLDGGYGNDVLISENDGNVLIGGAGSDVFDLSRVKDLSEIATDIIKDFQTGLDTIKLSKAHLGDDNVVTAVETTMNGVEGLALTTNVGTSTVNFAFLEGVSDLSAADFDGDYIPTIDVV